MFPLLKKLYSILNYKEKKHLIALSISMIIVSFLEMLVMMGVFPFLMIASNAEMIYANKYLNFLFVFFNFNDSNQFLFYLGIVLLTIIIIGNVFSCFIAWYSAYFSYLVGHELSLKLLKKYLSYPYSFFLNKNTVILQKNMLNDVQILVSSVLNPLLQVTGRAAICFSIFIGLFYASPKIAISTLGGLGGIYVIIYFKAKNFLFRTGKMASQLNGDKYKTLNEIFLSIKPLKLYCSEMSWVNKYAISSLQHAKYESSSIILPHLTRYLLEAISIGAIFSTCLYFFYNGVSLEKMVPSLGILVFAGYRILPSLQIIFTSITSIRSRLSSLELVCSEISNDSSTEGKNKIRPSFISKISFVDVSFSYEDRKNIILNGINFDIYKNQSIGIVGLSGAGKSTLVDLIMGLIEPTKGKIIVDNYDLQDLHQWGSLIGYVPQEVILHDDTIANNIRFGRSMGKSDESKLIESCKIADIYDYIVQDLPNKFETVVGERGISLSGGQRQRIAIARALYNNPEIIVFDEATSALDSFTESNIFDSISKMFGNKTIIVITHRATTVKNCDRILLLKNGALIDNGTYASLMDTSEEFIRLNSSIVDF